MFIVLHGGGTITRRIRPNNTNENDFERRKTDTFLVGTPVGIGEVEKITIGYEAETGVILDWYLKEAIVERVHGEGSRKSNCGCWLAKGEGDGTTVVELDAE